MNIILALSLFVLVAVSGSLIGIYAFRKSLQETSPPQPPKQALLTTAKTFGPISAARKKTEQQSVTKRSAVTPASATRRHGKKKAKPVKHAPLQQTTQTPHGSLESIITSATEGNPEAQYQLGIMYAKGDGVNKDRDRANKWLRKAANQGHAKAQRALEIVSE